MNTERRKLCPKHDTGAGPCYCNPPEVSFAPITHVKRPILPAKALDALGIKAGQRTWSIRAQAVRELIDEMITVHGISGKMLSDMQQYADQLERGEL